MKSMDYDARICDCCGSPQVESLWRYEHLTRTRNHHYQWHVNNVLCTQCGFVFVAPAPSEASLADYYGDSFSITSVKAPDYSVAKRVQLIRAFAPAGRRRFVEIGSNNCPAFMAEIEGLFSDIATIEINDECTSTHRDMNSLNAGSVDVLAAYFVLEHVPKPGEFLRQCRNLLSDDGILIIEVPNLYIYPRDPAGLFLHEHVNHFSPRTLINLAKVHGLTVLSVGQNDCSRPYGFAAVFQRAVGPSEQPMADEVEVLLGRSCIAEGKAVIDRFYARVLDTRAALQEADGAAVIWGSNEICSILLRDFDLPDGVVIVDSDPRKADYLPLYPTHLPHQMSAQLRDAKLIVINTKLHAAAITQWIQEKVGVDPREREIRILDY